MRLQAEGNIHTKYVINQVKCLLFHIVHGNIMKATNSSIAMDPWNIGMDYKELLPGTQLAMNQSDFLIVYKYIC